MILHLADGDENHPHAVCLLGGQHLPRYINEWCHETYNSDKFYIGYFVVFFSDEVDRNWFLLRWS